MPQPVVISRQQLRSEELPEFDFTGPFGGIISDISPDLVENYGFIDALNVIFLRGLAFARPGVNNIIALPAPSNEPIMGIADFFSSAVLRLQTIMTPTRLLQFSGGAWINIPPTTPLSGGSDDLFSWAIVNSQLCFSQGIDPVQLWDGQSSTFGPAAVAAVPAKCLLELDTHLVVANTIEGGVHAQRVRWTGAGDPTDWTSFDSGVTDLLNSLGPIRALVKLFQTGYALHQYGITQIIPTGTASAPFNFVPLTSKSRGTICPYSVGTSGEELAFYVGKDNIYAFNGTAAEPIGDMPISGRMRLGARARIFADLQGVDPTTVIGYVSENVNGRNYPAYWLIIPMISAWCYNYDEQNWTRFSFNKTVKTIGTFYQSDVIRIMDLIGPISAQLWTPATLEPSNPYDCILLGCADGTPQVIDFTNYSENPWQISGVNVMNDTRHRKTIKKFRIVMVDNGPVQFTITVRNDAGLSQTQTFPMGTGSGANISQVVGFSVSGIRLYWTVSGVAAQPVCISEMAPIYSIEGEQRGGAVDV